MKLNSNAQKHIDKISKGKTNLSLTIGYLNNTDMNIWTQDANGKLIEETDIRYEIGSLTKTFTAALAAKHIEGGNLQLEASIDQYIEGLPKQYYPSIRRLATHSAGYGQAPFKLLESLKLLLMGSKPGGFLTKNPFHGTLNEKRMIDVIVDKKLSDKDYKYSYSNLGMGILGYIAAQAQNQNYWEAINTFVKDELNLSNTGIGIDISLQGYSKKNHTCGNWVWDSNDIIAPAGALVSTAEDLLAWAKLNLEQKLSYLSLCHKQHGAGEKDFTMGLGWQLGKNRSLLWHGGNAGSFSTFLVLDKDKNSAVVVLCNYGLLDLKDTAIAVLDSITV